MKTMNQEQQEIYQQGYNAYESGELETANPYVDLDAEFWSDGWEDAQEDERQR